MCLFYSYAHIYTLRKGTKIIKRNVYSKIDRRKKHTVIKNSSNLKKTAEVILPGS
jgi:hypothetical protein